MPAPVPARRPPPAAGSDPAREKAPARDGELARKAGRGGIAIAGAKVFFILAGLVQQVALVHVLGLTVYGHLGLVQSLASVVYNPIVSTGVQGVSRAVAQAPDSERQAATRRAVTIHWLAVLPIAVGFFLAAPTIAGLMHAPHFVVPLRIVAAVMLLYGLYAPLIGVVNGHKQFGRQAFLDVLCATLRTVGLIGGAWYLAGRGLGVEGALGGFAIAAGVILVVALFVAGTGRRGPGGSSAGEHLAFIRRLFAGQFALNLLFQSDLQLLGRFAAEAAQQVALPLTEAGKLAGAYRNAQLFCFLPYQLLLSVTFVLFPLLASAFRDGDRQAVARYVRAGVRLAVVLAGLMVSVTASLPGPLLRLVFGEESARLGAPAMAILSPGLGAFAIFGILTAVLTSLKRERTSAILTLMALALVALLCVLLVRGQPFGGGMLVRTAISTAAGLGLATLLAAVYVWRTARAVVPPATLLRAGLGLGAAVLVARLLPEPGKLMTLVYCALVAAVYLAVLLLSRELRQADLDALRSIGRRERQPQAAHR